MKLSASRFNAHLAHMGQDAAWRRAFRCPCRDHHSGAAKTDCAQCRGLGTLWNAAVTGTVGVSGLKMQRAWAQFGMWEQGDVVLTIPSDSPVYAIGEFDRVTMVDSSEPFSVTLTRGDNDRLMGAVVGIDRCFWLDGDEAVVEGGIPTVASDGSLSWPVEDPPLVEPTAGEQYNLTGRRRPEYFCYGDFPQDRAHHSGEPLPRRVVLRQFDLFGRGT